MEIIDRVYWHYDNGYPEDLPSENAGTHIGMYLNWIIDNNLIASLNFKQYKQGIKDVKSRKITGRDFLFVYCDEEFWQEDLNKQALKFTTYYYQSPAKSLDVDGKYINDYQKVLGSEFKSFYEVPNNWDNYAKSQKQ